MENNKKIYVVGNYAYYANWLLPLGFIRTEYIDDADLVLFAGGEDIDPSLYNDKKHYNTRSNIDRDRKEIIAYQTALEYGIPMLGICRGHQFLCVMNNGKLIQHVTNHTAIHDIKLKLNNEVTEIKVTSTHHQMAYPYIMNPEDYRILGWSDSVSDKYMNGDDDDFREDLENFPRHFVEPEVLYYPKTKCLGIQAHPENMHNSPFQLMYFEKLFLNFINGKLS